MGLTNRSVARGAIDRTTAWRTDPHQRVVALAGNPNVGKSTVFNALTGLHQHTGNWPGKTVATAVGYFTTDAHSYALVDLPGTYSLMAHSAEEEIARDFLCFDQPDAVAVVCDATCLERNLHLVLQTIEITPRAVVCVNLLDEADRQHIHVDTKALSEVLGVPVVGVIARQPITLKGLTAALDRVIEQPPLSPFCVTYPDAVEQALALLAPHVPSRWVGIWLLDGDDAFLTRLSAHFGAEWMGDPERAAALAAARECLKTHGLEGDRLKDALVTARVEAAADIGRTVTRRQTASAKLDRRVDRVLTGKYTAYPVMLLLLLAVFWLTMIGSNYPSAALSTAFFWLQDRLTDCFTAWGAPAWLHGLLVLGVYRTLAWVVAVMLPPMAIFFPLFTLLEDVGYLPRVAYNLDRPFHRCRACGKQALTMCMGFGCNAAGVVGCRIIDSPRERLLAILTNSFVPCNGRFPLLVSMITMFLIGTAGGIWSSLASAAVLTAMIALGVGMTLVVTNWLSRTVLKGMPSSFTLELPPYRKPPFGKVIVRSVFDRTLFVLGRAAAVAAPAGALIWLMANITVGGVSLLNVCADFLDPFGRLLGMDGVIVMAFILGFPANEIVVPIMLMAYLQQGSLIDADNVWQLKTLLVNNGWTWLTAVNVMLFSLFHWPCSTTLLTVKKETGSWRWTALAAALPTAVGILICMALTALVK